ncbi:MAG: 30S ribosomal protein S5 [bacterium]
MGKPTRRKMNYKKEKPEFDQYILDLARVTRVTKGGKHLSFRVCVVLGNRKGKVGFGVAKGKDVQIGVEKAVKQAKKNMINVPIINNTLPHPIYYKFKASTVFLKPAPQGTGIIAGGPVRALLDLAGVPNVSAKILGKTKNKISIVKATFQALQSFKLSSFDQDKLKVNDQKVNDQVEKIDQTDKNVKE